MAFTSLSVDNFTITDSLVFNTDTNSPSDQDNYAFCQVRIIVANPLHVSYLNPEALYKKASKDIGIDAFIKIEEVKIDC